jgi:O-antigen/teichoic acid export membrane protein
LILSVVFFGYQQQLLNSIEAIDRPDLAFRINVVFVCLNVVANVLLIYSIGWVGAAIASALSTAVGLVLSFRMLRRQIDVTVPYAELSKQAAAALVMGAVVYTGERAETAYGVVNHNLVVVLILVCLGAGIYFTTLVLISPSFRTTVRRNLDTSQRVLN